jgi:hypothetical protein
MTTRRASDRVIPSRFEWEWECESVVPRERPPVPLSSAVETVDLLARPLLLAGDLAGRCPRALEVGRSFPSFCP